MNAPKKIILLLWLVIVASLGNVSASVRGATENRTWEKSLATAEMRLGEPLQTAGRHQENEGARYDFAPDSLLAAEGGVNANRLAGARAVDDFIAQAEANGMQVVGRETTFRTPFGARRIDVILLNPETGSIGGIEIKSSLGAFNRFDAAARQQFSADRWINTFGATSVGEQSGITINSTIKILWQAPFIR